MKFDNFITLCTTARFVNIQFTGNHDDALVTPSVSASSETEGCFCYPDTTEGFDFVIRKSDTAKATPAGNGLKMNVLVGEEHIEEGEKTIEHDGNVYAVREATVYFLALRELNPEKVLAAAKELETTKV